MRVDPDVRVKRTDDAFAQLEQEGAIYGYGLRTTEKHRLTVATLQPWLDSLIQQKGINPANPPVDAENMYFTNFFVTKVSWWRQESVQLFLSAVDRNGGIYRHRWGDAPIQT